MIRLAKALAAWGTPDFETVLKCEIAQLGAAHLPLQQGLKVGNYVADIPVSVMIIRVADLGAIIRAQAGIFYQGILSGCSCADDPSPVGQSNEYCEVQLDIDKRNAETSVALIE